MSEPTPHAETTSLPGPLRRAVRWVRELHARAWAPWLAWALAFGMSAWTLIRLTGIERGFPAVALIAYTPYVAVGGVALIVVGLLLKRWLPTLAIAACTVLLIAQVIPRTLPGDPPDPRPEGPELRLLTANLLQGGAELEPIAELIRDRDVDVLSVAELTPRARYDIAVSEIAELLPFRVVDARNGSAGTGLYSRYPMLGRVDSDAGGNDLPTLRADVEVPHGVTAEVYAIHPYPPSSPYGSAQLKRYLDAIPAAPADGEPPRILAGDFNSTLDHARFRDVLDRGYDDVADSLGEGLGWTWPQRLYPPPVTIDHVLGDGRIEALDYAVEDLPGSDHRAVYAEVRLPSAAQLDGP